MLKNKIYTIWPSNGLQSDLSLISAFKQRVPVQMIFQKKESRASERQSSQALIRAQWKPKLRSSNDRATAYISYELGRWEMD